MLALTRLRAVAGTSIEKRPSPSVNTTGVPDAVGPTTAIVTRALGMASPVSSVTTRPLTMMFGTIGDGGLTRGRLCLAGQRDCAENRGGERHMGHRGSKSGDWVIG